MSQANELITRKTRRRILWIGAGIGAVSGLVAASLLLQRAEREQVTPHISAGEGVKLGALVFGVLRQIALLGS